MEPFSHKPSPFSLALLTLARYIEKQASDNEHWGQGTRV